MVENAYGRADILSTIDFSGYTRICKRKYWITTIGYSKHSSDHPADRDEDMDMGARGRCFDDESRSDIAETVWQAEVGDIQPISYTTNVAM
jgi:hypothetical protein